VYFSSFALDISLFAVSHPHNARRVNYLPYSFSISSSGLQLCVERCLSVLADLFQVFVPAFGGRLILGHAAVQTTAMLCSVFLAYRINSVQLDFEMLG